MSSRRLPSVVVQWSPLLIVPLEYVLHPVSIGEALVFFPAVTLLYPYETLRYGQSVQYERFRERTTYGVLPWLVVGYVLHVIAMFVFLYAAYAALNEPDGWLFLALLHAPLMFVFVVPPAVVRIAGFVHRPTI
ncbi:hypothetical protein [Salarchaeum japonicum]|uniref:hypothetical protein n=1 Tax=Salarchaeum japonicum TaxID=555573 RepID=UPI003C713D1D